jgi:hypothetical protein
MENLALLAVQAQNVISSGNAVLNATQVSSSGACYVSLCGRWGGAG